MTQVQTPVATGEAPDPKVRRRIWVPLGSGGHHFLQGPAGTRTVAADFRGKYRAAHVCRKIA